MFQYRVDNLEVLGESSSPLPKAIIIKSQTQLDQHTIFEMASKRVADNYNVLLEAADSALVLDKKDIYDAALAARQGRTDDVLKYVSGGVPVNEVGYDGDSIITAAVSYKRTALVEYLLKYAGADCDATDKDKTPLFILAVRTSHIPTITAVCEALTRKYGRVNWNKITDKNGNTAMHYAAHYGSAPLMYFLGRLGAKGGIFNKLHSTPLHLAAYYGHLEAAKILLDKFHVDPKALSGKGATAYAIAKREGHEEIATLIKKFEIPTAQEEEEVTRKMSAEQYGESLVEFVHSFLEDVAGMEVEEKRKLAFERCPKADIDGEIGVVVDAAFSRWDDCLSVRIMKKDSAGITAFITEFDDVFVGTAPDANGIRDFGNTARIRGEYTADHHHLKIKFK